MSAIAITALAAGVLLYAACWRIAFRFLIWDEGEGDVFYEDILICSAIAMLAAPFVPVIALVVVAFRGLSPGQVALAVGGESRTQKRRRREREIEQREAHIRRLERELGIGVEDSQAALAEIRAQAQIGKSS